MMRAVPSSVLLLLAAPAAAAETLGVVAVFEPQGAVDGDLAELTHQLRAACRDRVGNVLDVPEMRARLLGQFSNATLSELDRAYGGALAVYQNGEFESAVRTLRAIVEDLEALPDSEEAYLQWERASLRFAHASSTIGENAPGDEVLTRLLMIDPRFQPDPDQYSPSFRRRVDALRAKVAARPRRKLAVLAEGGSGTVYVNGRPLGTTPVTVSLPAGTYRVGGASKTLRVPRFFVDLTSEDRTVSLDFGLADALRVNAGPGLALSAPTRADGIIRAGAWLGADRLVVASRGVEGEAQFLVGAIYDVRRGALLREGSVRMVAGTVPSANLGALAAFLLTGQSSREVKARSPDPVRAAPPVASVAPSPAPPVAASPPAAAPRDRAEPVAAGSAAPPRPQKAPATAEAPRQAMADASASALARASPRLAVAPPAPDPIAGPPPGVLNPRPPLARPWMRPAAIGAGALALGFAGLAVQQNLAAADAYAKARALRLPNGDFVDASVDPAAPQHYAALRADGMTATRNAWISAGVSVVLAAGAGALGWMSFDTGPAPLAVRF